MMYILSLSLALGASALIAGLIYFLAGFSFPALVLLITIVSLFTTSYILKNGSLR